MTGQEVLEKKWQMEEAIGKAIYVEKEAFEEATGYQVTGVIVDMFVDENGDRVEWLVDSVICTVMEPNKQKGIVEKGE